jgi:site-specific DNA-cytosine methylase
MSKINVMSCFDGISCGRVALQNVRIPVNKYFAFEIDKYSIKISEKNHPDITHLGDIKNWKFFDQLPKIDLLIGGSPCQGFSVAGDGLNFDDPRSKLFFEFVNILNYQRTKNPKIKFLMENVTMVPKWRDTISYYLGVEPVEINSSLVSAQNRKRLYWANWKIEQPKDKGIILQDIIEEGFVDREKSYCLDANYWKGGNPFNYFEKSRRQLVFDRPMMIGKANGINGHDILKRVYSQFGKSPTLTSHTGGNQEPKIDVNEINWRKLTPLECERLQTLPDNYTEGVSNTQRYKMLGNGWTVDVITGILEQMR